MAFVEHNITYDKLMELSKSHLALLVLDHRRSIILLNDRYSAKRRANHDKIPRRTQDRGH